MEWKEKQRKVFFDLLHQKWGRGKRVVAVPRPPPVKVLKVKNPKNPKPKEPIPVGLWHFPPEGYNEIPKGAGIFYDAQTFGAALAKKGFKRLGSGCFSTVYAKDGSDKVIKVTRRLDNWIDYIQWAAKKGYCGTFAPRVYSWKKIKGKGHEFSVSVVERMEKEAQRLGFDDDLYLIGNLMYPTLRGNTMAQLFMDELQPGLATFFVELVNEFKSHDLGGQNMMLRKDGSFCVTDPVAGSITTTSNRLRSRDFVSLAPALKGYYAVSQFSRGMGAN